MKPMNQVRTVSWCLVGVGVGMVAAAGCSSEPASERIGGTGQRIVFGQDNRVEYGALPNGSLRTWADATGALFGDGSLSCTASSCQLSTAPLTQGDTGEGGVLPLCAGERFLNQQAGAGCTAFLVGPDLAATAGHCVTDQASCDSLNVVFGFTADENGNNVRTNVPRSDVYACADLIAQVYTGSDAGDDWALFRLDRSVANRTPLAVRRSGTVANDASLVLLGHALTLPLKATLSGSVKNNAASAPKFQTNLDASPGNSGSPVINQQTGLVEGILTSGPVPEYQAVVRNGASCATATVCTDSSGCPSLFHEWTDVTRISGVVAALEGRSCHDDTRNGQETDVDCGGPECTPCGLGEACAADRDCPFRAVCQNAVCVQGPQCVTAADCLDPVAPACLSATCVNNSCNLDYSACGCRTSADCDDGRACTQDLCFSRTLQCIHIESNCEAPCTEANAVDLGAPGTATLVKNDGCVRVRDGYPFWWGTRRKLSLQTTGNNSSGAYPLPFTWTNTCAGGSGSGQFGANWQKQTLNPTSSACATLIDLKGNGSSNVSLWYFGE